MATTMLPKSYIIERIDARMASIASQGVKDAILVADGEAAERELWLWWLAKLQQHAEERATRAAAVRSELQHATIGVRDLIERAQRVKTDPPSDPSWSRNADRALDDRRTAGTTAKSRLHSSVAEGNALEHARAYLLDTPVAEFSMTALERLNLLSVIKFRLA